MGGFNGNSRSPVADDHTPTSDGKNGVREFPHERRMADKDDLVESTKIYGPSKHVPVLLAIKSIQRPHRLSRNSVS
jgi:hypothetical protein